MVLGDARLKLAAAPAGAYDLLLVDAFSSDAVPTHLLTVEALRELSRVLKPDGVVVLHLSNRNLDLRGPGRGGGQGGRRPCAGGRVLGPPRARPRPWPRRSTCC